MRRVQTEGALTGLVAIKLFTLCMFVFACQMACKRTRPNLDSKSASSAHPPSLPESSAVNREDQTISTPANPSMIDDGPRRIPKFVAPRERRAKAAETETL